jgi:hypothetical protein
MSSTRVKDRQGKHLDFYETPAKATDGLLETKFMEGEAECLLEPSAGCGAIIRRVKGMYPAIRITAVEIQEKFAETLVELGVEVIISDFLSTLPSPRYDRIIANPPYSQAEEFIFHALKYLKPDGKMAFLLRLPFLGSIKRYNLFKDFKPAEVHVLSQRPKFGGDNIDSCDYAWFIWGNGSADRTLLNWIGPT